MASGDQYLKTGQKPEIISKTWLDAMLPSRRDFVRRLFTVFTREEPTRVANIRDAVDNKDLERIQYLAHSLKGAAATMGCEQVRRTCIDLEEAANRKDFQEALVCTDRLEAEMDRVYKTMDRLLQTMDSEENPA